MLLTLNVVARQMRDKKRALELKNKPQCKLTDVKITRKFDEKQSVIKEEKKRASIQEARKKQFDLKMKDRRHALEQNHKRNTGGKSRRLLPANIDQRHGSFGKGRY